MHSEYAVRQARLCELLDEGWKIERVDCPHTCTNGHKELFSNTYALMVYLLSKEE